ncbi:MAG TPA: HD domain-containing phosphohydrolase, partial [Acidothermaceae bacterium]
WAALLHDIGKLRVPKTTLNKPAKLSPAEWETIRQHPLAGADLAAALLPWLGEWGKAIAEHHERFDGTGYPLGLAGRDISVAGRIVAVADSFEVMTASRAYKKAMTRGTALAEMVRCSGTQFDPDIVRALLEVSAPRLRWAMGPTSWLVGTPLLGSAPSLTAAGVAAQAAVGVSAVAVAAVTGLAGPALAASYSPTPSSSAAPVPTATASPAGSTSHSTTAHQLNRSSHIPTAAAPPPAGKPTKAAAAPAASPKAGPTKSAAAPPTKKAAQAPAALAKTTAPKKPAAPQPTPTPKAIPPPPKAAPPAKATPPAPTPSPKQTKTKKAKDQGNNGKGNGG